MTEGDLPPDQPAVAHPGPTFSANEAARLRGRVQGTVVLAGDVGYAAARRSFASNSQDFPQIVVACRVISDVQEALAFAHHHHLWAVCRAGGHSTAGYSVGSGMVIDVAGLDDITVDAVGRRAIVGAGCRFGRLNATLDHYGLHVPGGGCSDVAVAGYAQGGGYGLTSLMFGMHCDSVESALVVLADGSVVHADETHHPDLYWALRGGTGNNFGVLVQLTYRVRPLGELWGFSIGFDLDHAPEALVVMQRNYTGAATPEGLGHESFVLFDRGRERYVVRGVVDGTEEKGRAIVASLLSVPGASLDLQRRGGYTSLNEELLSLPDVPVVSRSIADSRYVKRPVVVDEWADLIDHFARTPNHGNFIAIEPSGGAIDDVETQATAYIHRRVSMDVFSWVFWADESEQELAETWLDGLIAKLDPLSNGEAYQNYPRRANRRFAEMYWGGAYPRLQAVKTIYDPDNFFNFEQSIRL